MMTLSHYSFSRYFLCNFKGNSSCSWELQATKGQENLNFEETRIGHQIYNSGTDFAVDKPSFYSTFFGPRVLQIGRRIYLMGHSCSTISRSSAVDIVTSVVDFYMPLYRKLRFQNRSSRILRPKAYFGAKALQIWWATITSHSQSSNTCMNSCFYVSLIAVLTP